MREIKFRAYEPDTKKMVEVFGINPMVQKIYVSRQQLFGEPGDDVILSYAPDDEYSYARLMQYTGLKDKNGVEIYEGDIFHLDDDMAPAVVEYTNEMDEQGSPAAEYSLALYEHGKRFQRLSMGEFYINKCEVIGNIYENPDLL